MDEDFYSRISEDMLIVYPTDTLYALGARIHDLEAVKKIYEVKKRPLTLPLPVGVHSIEQALEIGEFNDLAMRIWKRYMPGPLTLIVKNKKVPELITAGKKTIGIRMPANKIAISLFRYMGPLTITSANMHDSHVLPINAVEARAQLKNEDTIYYLDYGDTYYKAQSTIVDVTGEKMVILRQGILKIQVHI